MSKESHPAETIVVNSPSSCGKLINGTRTCRKRIGVINLSQRPVGKMEEGRRRREPEEGRKEGEMEVSRRGRRGMTG